jgi:hypothetical protein
MLMEVIGIVRMRGVSVVTHAFHGSVHLLSTVTGD